MPSLSSRVTRHYTPEASVVSEVTPSFHDFQPFTVVDFPGHVACTVFTAGCNLRCPYCHNADLIAPGAPSGTSEATFFRFLESRRNLLEGVCITGGEPTLFDIGPFIARIKALGYSVKLDTNGTRPERWIRWVREGLIDYIAMDIKVPLERYPEMGASPEAVRGIEQSVQYLLENRIPYEFRTTLHPNWLTETDIIQIGKWLKGARHLYLQPFIPSEKVLDPAFCEGMGYSQETLERFRGLLSETINRVVIRGE
jgi:pyruvate formate lyase activating enzyme